MLHSINACDLCGSHVPIQVAGAMPYHHIIFHHPHLGEENMRKHRALLGHFFHEVSQAGVLRLDGMVHVSLGGTQPQDWQLEAQAARHGFKLALRTVRTPSPAALQVLSHGHQSAETPCMRRTLAVQVSTITYR